MQIDLDVPLLECLQRSPWTESDAMAAATAIAQDHGLAIEYEPGDEEWIRLSNTGGRIAMISVLLPFVLATGQLIPALRLRGCTIAGVEDFRTDHLRASPELLRRTVLRTWAVDFDPDGFSPDDLFIESV